MSPSSTMIFTTALLAAASTFVAAAPTNKVRQNEQWSIAFSSGNDCSSQAPFQTAAGYGPSTGCATVTKSDGVTPASAGAISVTDPGYTIVWYSDAQCSNQLPIDITGSPYSGYDHCDVVSEGQAPAAYYKVTTKSN